MSASLDLPAISYGPFADVRQRVSGAIERFAAGEPWHEALAAGDAVTPSTSPGLIVLNGPAPMLASAPHFHAFLPLSLVLEGVQAQKINESRMRQAVQESLSTPWGLLGILAPVNQMLVYPPALHRPILQGAVRWWDTLDSVGPRYTVGLREGARLWNVTTNLHYVLGQVGLNNEQLRAPLPASGLRAIVPPGILEVERS
jgi:hypothetical protein